jgi:UDP-N-acetylmuramoyl-tripeptide--D-alanyl-D-alanine ligase
MINRLPEKYRALNLPPFSGVAFDSREIKGGELFIPLPSSTEASSESSLHGNNFIKDAYERGAALSFFEGDSIPRELSSLKSFTIIPVSDTREAFFNIASFWRRELKTPLLGVTGSVGKTTVKEMCARILLTKDVTLYSKKSYNNHTGVPYTLCHLTPDHRSGVIEMGMNHAGELTILSEIATPDAVLMTKIAPAHIENFPNIEAIADAKLEIISHMRKDGTIILNGDDEILLKRFREYRDKRLDHQEVCFFGEKVTDHNDLQVSDIKSLGVDGITFTLRYQGEKVDITLSTLGLHNAYNAAAAALGALVINRNLTLQDVKNGLERYTPAVMRLEVIPLRDGRSIVNDCYNANPTSMAALLEIAKDLRNSGHKLGFLLGDMKELGESADHFHTEIGSQLVSLHPEVVIALGEFADNYCNASKAAGFNTSSLSKNEYDEGCRTALSHKWDTLLVKGSRSMQLEKIVEKIVSGAALN